MKRKRVEGTIGTGNMVSGWRGSRPGRGVKSRAALPGVLLEVR